MSEAIKLNNIFSAFKIAANCVNYTEYKNAYYYDVELKPGAKIRDIEKYSGELSLALKAPSKLYLRPITEKGLIRLEFFKKHGDKIDLLDLGSKSKCPAGKLNCLLGETLEGEPLWLDIVSNPHMLIAGCTGSGKSTLLHVIIANMLLYKNVSINLMDPKNIEFYKYADVKSKSIGIAYDYVNCVKMLQALTNEMDNRYDIMRSKRIDSSYFPYSVLIIDEFADLIMQDESKAFYNLLCKLSQKSRSAGIHIIIATQRPSVDVVDGSIKANFPSRISCKVATGIDSRVILDTLGAENLVGYGDALIKNGNGIQRFQVAHITPDEVVSCIGNR